ncbi:response regulator [Pikeienuella piscinae]|uniref:Response regulator n=1 Tax=Pikeienuella piscinae TaxID=2748098 RepID=A0A7L5BWT5_9RHOB|nr:response regulator [Pikeienuella piscinae]QIE55911.1 response regulator [Pikeienuella piscinae]
MQKKILIVEDNALNLRLFNDLLAAEGYDTVTSNGEGDIAGLARTTRPDLIVMDMRLAQNDGLETTRRIKRDETTRAIPVIAITGCAMAGDEERIMATGCADYLTKPVTLQGFLSSVRRHMH